MLTVDCEELFVGGFFFVYLLRYKGFFRAGASKTSLTSLSLGPSPVFFGKRTADSSSAGELYLDILR